MPAPKPVNPAIPSTGAELSEFLLRACHDLRGPIRIVRTNAELLARNRAAEGGDESARSLDFILQGARLAGEMIDGLTDYSLALGINPSSFQPVPTDVILRGALARLSNKLREQNADVTYGALPTIPGDADRLQQLFQYLLEDAVIRRGPGNLRVRISAEPHPDGWLFTLRDNGVGWETELLDRIFAPFERLNGRQRSGPGLATCRVIVERHGGRIWAESEPGASGAFRIVLPAQ